MKIGDKFLVKAPYSGEIEPHATLHVVEPEPSTYDDSVVLELHVVRVLKPARVFVEVPPESLDPAPVEVNAPLADSVVHEGDLLAPSGEVE